MKEFHPSPKLPAPLSKMPRLHVDDQLIKRQILVAIPNIKELLL